MRYIFIKSTPMQAAASLIESSPDKKHHEKIIAQYGHVPSFMFVVGALCLHSCKNQDWRVYATRTHTRTHTHTQNSQGHSEANTRLVFQPCPWSERLHRGEPLGDVCVTRTGSIQRLSLRYGIRRLSEKSD